MSSKAAERLSYQMSPSLSSPPQPVQHKKETSFINQILFRRLHWSKREGKKKHISSVNMTVMTNKILQRGKAQRGLILPSDHTAN